MLRRGPLRPYHMGSTILFWHQGGMDLRLVGNFASYFFFIFQGKKKTQTTVTRTFVLYVCVLFSPDPRKCFLRIN